MQSTGFSLYSLRINISVWLIPPPFNRVIQFYATVPSSSQELISSCCTCWHRGERFLSVDTHKGNNLSEKRCPSCDRLMETGYLISRRGIFWNAHVPRFVAHGESLSGRKTQPVFRCCHIKAFRCQNCRILIYGIGNPPTTIAKCPYCSAVYTYHVETSNSVTLVCQNCGKEFPMLKSQLTSA